MDTQTPQLNFNLPKHTHKILWSVLGVLLLVVIVGSVYWWKAEKETPTLRSEQAETLAGVDADNNGVRDDVQKYIEESFKSSATVVKALKEIAKREQEILLVNGEDNIYQTTLELNKGIDCLVYTIGVNDAIKQSDELESRMMNTKERIMKYSAQQSLISGRSFPLTPPSKDSCNFDSDLLGWKTYTNTEHGFEFKYVDRFSVPGGEEFTTKSGVNFFFDILPENMAKYLSDLEKQADILEENIVQTNDLEWKTLKLKEKIGGEEFYVAVLESDNKVFKFTINNIPNAPQEINQVLSTFKFTK